MALTAQEICALARQMAKVRGYESQSGQLLNAILQDLAESYDFAQNSAVTTITLAVATGSGPYSLPSNYLRAIYDGVFFTIQGVKYQLTPVDYEQYQNLVQTAGLENYPTVWATDMSTSPPGGYVWMPPSGAYPLTVNYYKQPDDITTPETSTTVPWFPNTNYLITRLAGELCKLSDDQRWLQFLGDGPQGAVGILRGYLNLKDDSSNRSKTVKLDRRRFGSGYNRLPNTKLVGF